MLKKRSKILEAVHETATELYSEMGGWAKVAHWHCAQIATSGAKNRIAGGGVRWSPNAQNQLRDWPREQVA
jgi:hypothetical protein